MPPCRGEVASTPPRDHTAPMCTFAQNSRTCSSGNSRPDVTVQTVSQFRPLKGRVSLVGSAPLDTVTVPVNVTLISLLPRAFLLVRPASCTRHLERSCKTCILFRTRISKQGRMQLASTTAYVLRSMKSTTSYETSSFPHCGLEIRRANSSSRLISRLISRLPLLHVLVDYICRSSLLERVSLPQ